MDEDDLRAFVVSENLRKKRNAESWGPEQEQLIISLYEKSESYRWMHARSSSKIRRGGKFLVYSSIAFSSVLGLLNLLVTAHTSSSNVLTYVTGALSLLGASLSTYEQLDNSMDTASNHESAASNFASFMRTLNLELSLNPEDRRGFMDFLQIAKAEYERMVTTAPNIIDSILTEFAVKYPNKRNVPEIVAVEHPMTIYKRNTATVDQNEYREIRKLYNMRFGVMDGGPSSTQHVSKPLTNRSEDELSKIDADLSKLEIV